MSSAVIYVLMINEIPRPSGTTDLHKENGLQVHNIVKHPKESVDSVFFGQKATSGFIYGLRTECVSNTKR